MSAVLFLVLAAVVVIAPFVAVCELSRVGRKAFVWAVVLAASVACVAWFVRGVKASAWRMDQHLHIRWNVMCFSDQYARIDKLGDEGLRRDYVTNFCGNACTLLNLSCKTAPNTYKLVERYYFDWDERIDAAESAKSSRHAGDPQ